MGSSDWFKTIISRKKTKQDRSKKIQESATEQSNGFRWRTRSDKDSDKLHDATSSGNPGVLGMPVEDFAATRIQTAFRGYKARNILRSLKGVERLRVFTECHPVKKQAATTLSYLQTWNRMQTQISARRLCMVTEGRIRQKKQDNQLKLEAKLHDLEVEWCGGFDTMEEILSRIQQREEAAVKRERAMAYAFSHQWRASSGQNQGQFVYEFGKGNWGWSWMERWIAARPWEVRLPTRSTSPKKVQTKVTSKVSKNTSPSVRRVSSSVKPAASNGKGSMKRLSMPELNSKPISSSPPEPKGAQSRQEEQEPSSQTVEVDG